MQSTLHLKSSFLLARSSSVSRNCSDLRTPNSRCSQSSHSRNTFQSRSGRKDFLPVEPQGGLSFLFLLSAPGSLKITPLACLATPDPFRTHGRPSVQECRLRLKRPSSIFCNMFICSTLWMYDLAVTQFSLAFSTNPIDGGRQFDLRM